MQKRMATNYKKLGNDKQFFTKRFSQQLIQVNYIKFKTIVCAAK